MGWKALGQCTSPVHPKYIGMKKVKMALVSNVLELLLIKFIEFRYHFASPKAG